MAQPVSRTLVRRGCLWRHLDWLRRRDRSIRARSVHDLRRGRRPAPGRDPGHPSGPLRSALARFRARRTDARGSRRVRSPDVAFAAQGLSSDSTEVITEDRDGYLYVGRGQGIDRFDPATGRVKHSPPPTVSRRACCTRRSPTAMSAVVWLLERTHAVRAEDRETAGRTSRLDQCGTSHGHPANHVGTGRALDVAAGSRAGSKSAGD